MADRKAVWYDTKNRKVVTGKQPEEAIQIWTGNEDVSDEEWQARIDFLGGAPSADEVAATSAAPVETATAPAPKRTATVKSSAKK